MRSLYQLTLVLFVVPLSVVCQVSLSQSTVPVLYIDAASRSPTYSAPAAGYSAAPAYSPAGTAPTYAITSAIPASTISAIPATLVSAIPASTVPAYSPVSAGTTYATSVGQGGAFYDASAAFAGRGGGILYLVGGGAGSGYSAGQTYTATTGSTYGTGAAYSASPPVTSGLLYDTSTAYGTSSGYGGSTVYVVGGGAGSGYGGSPTYTTAAVPYSSGATYAPVSGLGSLVYDTSASAYGGSTSAGATYGGSTSAGATYGGSSSYGGTVLYVG